MKINQATLQAALKAAMESRSTRCTIIPIEYGSLGSSPSPFCGTPPEAVKFYEKALKSSIVAYYIDEAPELKRSATKLLKISFQSTALDVVPAVELAMRSGFSHCSYVGTDVIGDKLFILSHVKLTPSESFTEYSRHIS